METWEESFQASLEMENAKESIPQKEIQCCSDHTVHDIARIIVTFAYSIHYISRNEKAKDTHNILSIVRMKGVTNMEPLHIVTDVSPNEKLLGRLHKVICELLEDMDALWENTPKRPRIDQPVTLSETPISFKRTHRHSLIFLSKPIDLTISIPRIGRFTFPLPPGWNKLNLPSGTELALASEGSLSAVYRCSDTLP